MEILTNEDVIEHVQRLNVPVDDWLIDRAANAEQIAETKTGMDREGWLADASYFRAAASLVRLATAHLGDDSGWQNAETDKPKAGRGVRVWCPGNKCQYMAYWTGKAWKAWNIGAEELKGITHWQELSADPPVPTEDSSS